MDLDELFISCQDYNNSEYNYNHSLICFYSENNKTELIATIFDIENNFTKINSTKFEFEKKSIIDIRSSSSKNKNKILIYINLYENNINNNGYDYNDTFCLLYDISRTDYRLPESGHWLF